MDYPFFYIEEIAAGSSRLTLNEETSRHVVQVLRMQKGNGIHLTDGRGNIYTAEITDDHKKKCVVALVSREAVQQNQRKVTMGISLLKNTSRFEWFLEKATEIGVGEIIPLICERTEKQHFRPDRMKSILVSAMLQSQQCWLPQLHEPQKLQMTLTRKFAGEKFMAHCAEDAAKKPFNHMLSLEQINVQPAGKPLEKMILIGPEGDFSLQEIEQAFDHQFIPVSLGMTRLRTETAGIVAAALLCNI